MLYVSQLGATNALAFATASNNLAYSVIGTTSTGSEGIPYAKSCKDFKEYKAGSSIKRFVGVSKFMKKQSPPIRWVTKAEYAATTVKNMSTVLLFPSTNIPNGV